MNTVEQWGVLELSFEGKKDGNPFMDYEIYAQFKNHTEEKKVNGFYDGDGVYKVRFMPSCVGIYDFTVGGTFSENQHDDNGVILQDGLDCTEYTGQFEVIPAGNGNHGMVRVLDERYFQYSDGTPHHSFGTTCYAWAYQNMEIQEQTLHTLEQSCFNKIRFCMFPKYYQYNEIEPEIYPYIRGEKKGIDEDRQRRMIRFDFERKYEKKDITDFDCTRFNIELFRVFDTRIMQLSRMGIEADLILFHAYDKWGFANMTMECDKLYLKYITARYSAFRNIWWSMANEYDLMSKTNEEWEELAKIVKDNDPYHHLISIHNCFRYYDYHKDWITHCSMQRIDFYKHVELTDALLQEYRKPIVWDEICYEGNINNGWGNISGEELVRRFWETSLRGGFAGHGETYENVNDILWWSHGGVLHGTSEPRISFLKKIMEQIPGDFLKRKIGMFDEVIGIPYQTELPKRRPYVDPPAFADYEIRYYGITRPAWKEINFPEEEKFQVDVIDTWHMTIIDAGIHSGFTKIKLPGKEYMAIRIQRVY